MSEVTKRLEEFVQYVALLDGDEKGEAQVFCDRLFKAFGHAGYKEAHATLEFRLRGATNRGTSFADLMWKPRLLLEMKKRGENLRLHYQQVFDYWINAVPNRPRYVVLCNFDTFWIYDFDKQIDEPIDIVAVADLPQRYTALNFLFPDDPTPIFGNDRTEVSRGTADKIAALFRSLISRDVSRDRAQRFILQLVVSLFSEDIGLLPSGLVATLVRDCLTRGHNAHDLFSALFAQMNNPARPAGGRFKKVPYFNGGLFATIDLFDLNDEELEVIGGERGAAMENWSKVNPAIFGTIFQGSMDAATRHTMGAHYTSEVDILRVVIPTIVRPWREAIGAANTMKELLAVRGLLMDFRVLDPACGSGNFLYVAYRELVRVEMELMAKLKDSVSAKSFAEHAKSVSLISPRQFYGIEQDSFGAELAKVTLMLAKKLALDEAMETLESRQIELPLSENDALPLDNLDDNILRADALFVDWPAADVIIGNPPFLDARKITKERGRAYAKKLRSEYKAIPGRADYCVYWFRKAHDALPEFDEKTPAIGRAGLVGTNSIRQNYSREGGLDYVVQNGGTIVDAVASQVWSGEAAVNVSIVNWVKGEYSGTKVLQEQMGDSRSSEWRREEAPRINSSLTTGIDVSIAKDLQQNLRPKRCFEGMQPGHKGFRISQAECRALIAGQPDARDVLFRYLIGDDLLSGSYIDEPEFLIDFSGKSIFEAGDYPKVLEIVRSRVLAKWEENAEAEFDETGESAGEHQNRLKTWWQLKRRRSDMLEAVKRLSRYAVCVRHTKRPLFEFISGETRPDSALTVFAFEDDYSFGVLQSDVHWRWFLARCSTIKRDFRYTNETVFSSFAWPQNPTARQVKEVAEQAVELRLVRTNLMAQHDLPLRALYRTLDQPGTSELKDAHQALADAVRAAYGMKDADSELKFLLDLNLGLAADAAKVQGPGLPTRAAETFVTPDFVAGWPPEA